VWQVAGEYLEYRPAVRGTAVQRGLEHGEFIMVSQQRGPRHTIYRRGATEVQGFAVHRIGHRWKTTYKEVRTSERGTR